MNELYIIEIDYCEGLPEHVYFQSAEDAENHAEFIRHETGLLKNAVTVRTLVPFERKPK
jgi:hypothetical protein